jgi:hypothetical protein
LSHSISSKNTSVWESSKYQWSQWQRKSQCDAFLTGKMENQFLVLNLQNSLDQLINSIYLLSALFSTVWWTKWMQWFHGSISNLAPLWRALGRGRGGGQGKGRGM